MAFDAFYRSLEHTWSSLLGFLPTLLGALLLLLLGWFLANALSTVVKKLGFFNKLDARFQRTTLAQTLKSSGLGIRIPIALAWIIKWFIIIVVFSAVADTLGWIQVTEFMTQVALYIPNILIATVIIAFGIIASDFVHAIVSKATTASGRLKEESAILSNIAKWAVILFAVSAALVQLGIAPSLVQIVFAGVVAGASLALGLSFGLGGRDAARQSIERMQKKMDHNQL